MFLHFFQNSPNMAPVKGGFGGFPNDIFDVMQGSIYAYILCIALIYNNYMTYIFRDESKTLSGDPTRLGRPSRALAAAHFAELRSFRRGWMALRALQDFMMDCM